MLYDKLSDRYKDILSIPDWDKEDLKELEGRLRRTTISKIKKKKFILERLAHVLSNAQSPMTYKEIRDIVFYGGI